MLSDEQINEIALAYVKKTNGQLLPVRPVTLTDPAGIFFKVAREHSVKSTTLVPPFFVARATGSVVPISPGDVMPGIVNKLWGWASMRADPQLQLAIIDPDFGNPKHIEVWSQIVREIMNGPKGQPKEST